MQIRLTDGSWRNFVATDELTSSAAEGRKEMTVARLQAILFPTTVPSFDTATTTAAAAANQAAGFVTVGENWFFPVQIRAIPRTAGTTAGTFNEATGPVSVVQTLNIPVAQWNHAIAQAALATRLNGITTSARLVVNTELDRAGTKRTAANLTAIYDAIALAIAGMSPPVTVNASNPNPFSVTGISLAATDALIRPGANDDIFGASGGIDRFAVVRVAFGGGFINHTVRIPVTINPKAATTPEASAAPTGINASVASGATLSIAGPISGNLTATATGAGTLAYQWYQSDADNNFDIEDAGVTALGATATIAIPTTLTPAGDYFFFVVVTHTETGKTAATARSSMLTVAITA
jgi:hypothetical protein